MAQLHLDSAKVWLEDFDLWPSNKLTQTEFARTATNKLVALLRMIHPEYSQKEALSWVEQNAIRYVPTPKRSMPDIWLDTDYLPLLGKATNMAQKMAVYQHMQRHSVRAMAEEEGLDPETVVALTQRIAEELPEFLVKEGFVTYRAAQNDVKLIGGPTEPPTDATGKALSSNQIKKLAADTMRTAALQDFVSHVFVSPTAGEPKDFMVTRMAAQLLGLSTLRQKEVTTDEYPPLTAKEMHEQIHSDSDVPDPEITDTRSVEMRLSRPVSSSIKRGN